MRFMVCKKSVRFNLTLVLIAYSQIPFQMKAQERPFSYVPTIHGTFRGKYELEPERMENRFQVRNARLSVAGSAAPVVDYMVEADFCDRGKFAMTDAWARVSIAGNYAVQAGQMRIPFSIDATRQPRELVFANRSFIGKQVGNVRGVGVKGTVKVPSTGVILEAGVFNTTSISDHQVWLKRMAYAGKINYTLDNVRFEFGLESVVPDSVRINLLDGSVSWSSDRWLVEGEYICKRYTGDSYKTCHAYNVMANYGMPVKWGVFNLLSFQGRLDGMTDHSDGTRDESGRLFTTEQARNRVSLGTTISYVHPKVRTDLRLNYENYIYHSGAVTSSGDRDKIVVELIVSF